MKIEYRDKEFPTGLDEDISDRVRELLKQKINRLLDTTGLKDLKNKVCEIIDKEMPSLEDMNESRIEGDYIRSWNPIKLYKVIKLVSDISNKKINNIDAKEKLKDIFKNEPEIIKHIDKTFFTSKKPYITLESENVKVKDFKLLIDKQIYPEVVKMVSDLERLKKEDLKNSNGVVSGDIDTILNIGKKVAELNLNLSKAIQSLEVIE